MTRRPPAALLSGVGFAHVRGMPVLVDVDLEIERGERVAIIGPNGGGKTTLLRLLLGLLEPEVGTVEIFGRPPCENRWQIGYVPQHATIDVSAPASVLDVVLMGCLRRSLWGPWFTNHDRAQAQATLHRVGLSAVAGRRIDELSGGQLQRVLIARALISAPEMLLLDEPTSGVDAENEAAIMALLLGLNEATLILVSHDQRQVSTDFDRVVHVHHRVRPWLCLP